MRGVGRLRRADSKATQYPPRVAVRRRRWKGATQMRESSCAEPCVLVRTRNCRGGASQITRAIPRLPLDELRRVPFSTFQLMCSWWPALLHAAKTAHEAMRNGVFGGSYWQMQERSREARAGPFPPLAVPHDVADASDVMEAKLVQMELAVTGNDFVDQVRGAAIVARCTARGATSPRAGVPGAAPAGCSLRRGPQSTPVHGVDEADAAPGTYPARQWTLLRARFSRGVSCIGVHTSGSNLRAEATAPRSAALPCCVNVCVSHGAGSAFPFPRRGRVWAECVRHAVGQFSKLCSAARVSHNSALHCCKWPPASVFEWIARTAQRGDSCALQARTLASCHQHASSTGVMTVDVEILCTWS